MDIRYVTEDFKLRKELRISWTLSYFTGRDVWEINTWLFKKDPVWSVDKTEHSRKYVPFE